METNQKKDVGCFQAMYSSKYDILFVTHASMPDYFFQCLSDLGVTDWFNVVGSGKKNHINVAGFQGRC